MASVDFSVNAVATMLEATATEGGKRLVDLTDQSPVLLVFLRHAGCTFCREALADIAEARDKIEARGIRILLVYMGDREGMLQVVTKYGLTDLDRIADGTQSLYAAFGLKKGTFRQLFGFKVWWRGFVAGLLRGHGRGNPTVDYRQMPGVFYLEQGLIAKRFRHRSAADRPDYGSICSP